ncbi:hypothetical protein COT48_05585 [Candidatus Woesearchaeota archaeon CG08_land_8_20_14_0_20_47_9]|nr:MAG: hypothetical protein AUJ69_02285 [Candidatus Woesearchaeota archaeon CG1_02_47_18]PIN72931.1 MAG: hypothetical protein COV22_01900 [Candidatus Woesearchaeota archaeon CG10_big_fil_rev_8_21_14_0_10_47_5]PIO03282.1 MAG: hypothetical protein COT48_05585 [Candidatus Woesearchaeota archaeon CG08_land_8_20_14_0_20_47_9]HII30222.1 hypothetical protein [Candidatus Woesearchaeota archaeon]
MIITIDTKQDSEEEISRAILLLSGLIRQRQGQTTQTCAQPVMQAQAENNGQGFGFEALNNSDGQDGQGQPSEQVCEEEPEPDEAVGFNLPDIFKASRGEERKPGRWDEEKDTSEVKKECSLPSRVIPY